MTKDQIIALAREAGFWNGLGIDGLDELERFAALVAAAEREACAQLCEDHFSSDGDYCAKQIRNRK
jgi:DNA-binding GntR family transcriptional regulator